MGDGDRVAEARISRIEFGVLDGVRPRAAGRNARLGDHGVRVNVPLVRVTTEDGAAGFGFSRAGQDELKPLLGCRFGDAFVAGHGVADDWLSCEYALWDLAGKYAGQPVYRLAAAMVGTSVTEPFRVRCYDTSLYFDDLHLDTEAEAAALMAAEAREGYERGHRAFKIKVGRGARHLPLERGTARDIAIVHAVRAAVGSEGTVMLDANNGYNLNLAKRVLEETTDCHIFWLEEPFHEDAVLYDDLKAWLKYRDLHVLIADGEGQAHPDLLNWTRDGLVDVVQYDIFSHGFTRWLETGRQLDAWGARTAPHHYGGHFGNYAACHLAGSIHGFAFVEWDEAATLGLDANAYTIDEGWVSVPSSPGFGLDLDDERFTHAVASTGFTLNL